MKRVVYPSCLDFTSSFQMQFERLFAIDLETSMLLFIQDHAISPLDAKYVVTGNNLFFIACQ